MAINQMASKIKIAVIFILLTTVIAAGYYLLFISKNNNRQTACKIYGFYAAEISNQAREEKTGFFSIDPKTFVIERIGPLHKDKEYQGIEYIPSSKLFYTNTSNDGLLQSVDPLSGAIKRIGNIPYIKISSFAYRANDDSLWAWAEEQGAVKINQQTADGSLQIRSNKEVGAMAWDEAGKNLYVAIEESKQMYVFGENDEPKLVSKNIPENTTGLTTLKGGLLLGGALDEDESRFTIYTYDPSADKIIFSKTINTDFNDISSVTWPLECVIPF